MRTKLLLALEDDNPQPVIDAMRAVVKKTTGGRWYREDAFIYSTGWGRFTNPAGKTVVLNGAKSEDDLFVGEGFEGVNDEYVDVDYIISTSPPFLAVIAGWIDDVSDRHHLYQYRSGDQAQSEPDRALCNSCMTAYPCVDRKAAIKVARTWVERLDG